MSPAERPKWGDPGSQAPLFGPPHHISLLPLRSVQFSTYRYLGSERLRYFPTVKQLEVVQAVNPDKPGSGFNILTCPQCVQQTYHQVGIRAMAECFVRQESSEESHPLRGSEGHGITGRPSCQGYLGQLPTTPSFLLSLMEGAGVAAGASRESCPLALISSPSGKALWLKSSRCQWVPAGL